MEATRVLVIHNVLWAHYKAAVFTELCRRAEAHGFDVQVVHVATTESRRVALNAPVDTSIHRYPWKVLFEEPFDRTWALARAWRIAREILRRRPRVVVVPGYADLGDWAALAVARCLGAKVVVSVDSTEMDRPRRAAKESLKKAFLASCTAAFGYGVRSREYCRKLGMDDERIFTRCQATDSEPIVAQFASARQAARPTRTFMYLGRLSAEKNLETLIDAFRDFRAGAGEELRDRWRLEIVGGGPLRADLERRARAAAGDAISFSDGVGWKEVGRVLARADVLVLPSVSEPWGLVVNEAMACGLPVLISANCGCVPDLVIEGKTGLTFAPLRTGQLAAAMSRLAGDDKLREEMGANAREQISQFTPATAARQMIAGLELVRSSAGGDGHR
jgi:glycosyltransferase involved in cell wall biosynthesis